jgi:hypothetical protein
MSYIACRLRASSNRRTATVSGRKPIPILDTILVKLLASTVRRTTKSAPTSHIDARIDQLLAFDNRSKSDPVKEVYRQETITYLAD